LHRAHELAYAAIKRRWPDAPVGLSHHKVPVHACFAQASRRVATKVVQSVIDRWPVGFAQLRRVVEATSDYIGIAHYWGQMVAFDPRSPGNQFVRRFNPPGAEPTEMGWVSQPAWMREVLGEVRGTASRSTSRRMASPLRTTRGARGT